MAGGMKRGGATTVQVDPAEIFFTHARVRPFFTGCNKRIEDTLAEIVNGETEISALPLITVLEIDGHLFSLNNRRLYLFKTLRSLGKLPGNKITAYTKAPLEREKLRYTPERCSLTARLFKEHNRGENEEGEHDNESDGEEEHTEVVELPKLVGRPTTQAASNEKKNVEGRGSKKNRKGRRGDDSSEDEGAPPRPAPVPKPAAGGKKAKAKNAKGKRRGDDSGDDSDSAVAELLRAMRTSD